MLYQALSQLVNKIINTATCLIENFMGNFIGQIVNQITGLINAALRPISNLIGSVIGFTNEVLDFVISILDFLLCKPQNICPQREVESIEWIPRPQLLQLDFESVFNAAKGVGDSLQAVGDIPENLADYNFNFNANSALKDMLTDCNL